MFSAWGDPTNRSPCDPLVRPQPSVLTQSLNPGCHLATYIEAMNSSASSSAASVTFLSVLRLFCSTYWNRLIYLFLFVLLLNHSVLLSGMHLIEFNILILIIEISNENIETIRFWESLISTNIHHRIFEATNKHLKILSLFPFVQVA